MSTSTVETISATEVVGTWRKLPVTVQAAQLTGDAAHDRAVYQWIEDNTLGSFDPLKVLEGRVPVQRREHRPRHWALPRCYC